MKRLSVDSRRDLIVLRNREEAISYATAHWVGCASEAIALRGRFVVALSGGSSPKAIYERLATITSLDWNKVHLFWSDERAVSPDSEESNYHMAMASGLSSLPIKHIHRMRAEKEIEKEAAAYDELTSRHSPFDLIMLGMGDDGHTASLFPETEALQERAHLIVANFVPQKKTWRMTMTFPCLNSAREVVFYVFGSDKKERLKEILTPRCTLPAAQVGTPHAKALWITDIPL